MIKTIFINRKDTIDTYQININKRKIERIQKAMDNFSIKDEEQKITTNSDFFVSNPDFFGKKIKKNICTASRTICIRKFRDT